MRIYKAISRAIFLAVVSLVLLSACGQVRENALLEHPSPYQNIPHISNGITVTMDNNKYTRPLQQIEINIRNDSRELFSYGNFFYIEKEVEGAWYMVKFSDAVFFKDPAFKDFGLILEENQSLIEIYSFDELHLKLGPGNYRLVKSFTPIVSQNEKILIAVPFEIIH